MVWGKTSDRGEQRARGDALTAAYRGPEGMPVYDRPGMRGGSRGGAPIWVMREAWMARQCDCCFGPLDENAGRCGYCWPCCQKYHQPDGARGYGGSVAVRADRACSCPEPSCLRHGFDNVSAGATDPDGFAVFGRYPHGFLAHVVKLQLLGDIHREDILHVCSGTLSDSEKWTVDIRAEARPRVQASGTALPFRDGSFAAVMLDPPYSDEYARNLYKVENPRPSWLLKEAARVVVPGGRVGILHVAIPFSPPGCRLVNVWGISTGVGFRIRAFTVYEKHQDELAL